MNDLAKSITQALGLATRLRSISQNLKEGEFKRLCDALLVELAEVQMKLDEVLTENATLKAQSQAEEDSGVICCPRCFEQGWHLVETRPHKTPGVVVQVWACPKCKLKEETIVKPK
jgi:Zn finger protein HypA/HybF involved in hydrogenase expression